MNNIELSGVLGHIEIQRFENQINTLDFCFKQFSQLASLKMGEFFTHSNNTFERHENTAYNRYSTVFNSKEGVFNAVDALISKCAETIEVTRFNYHPLKYSTSNLINSERAILQTLHSTLPQSLESFEKLKKVWNDPETSYKINSLQGKIEVLSTNIIEVNNFIISSNIKGIKPGFSKSLLINKCKSDDYLEKFINNFLQKKIENEIQPSYFSKGEVIKHLVKLFGAQLTTEIMTLYRLDTFAFISSTDLKALLIGIAANITYENLEVILDLKNPNLLEGVKISTPITHEERAQFLNHLRDISFFSEKDLNFPLKNIPYYRQLKKDQTFLKSCLWINNLNLSKLQVKTASLQEFASAEYLARKIVYGLYPLDEYTSFKEGTLVPVPISFTPTQKTLLMQAHSLYNSKGLHCVVLIPSCFDDKSCSDTIPIQILFRGSRNYAAWNRNLNPIEKSGDWMEWGGPGGKSFAANKEVLLKQLDRVLAQIPKDKPAKIEIMGHSLGGTDGQRMCEAVVSKISRDRKSAMYLEESRKQDSAFNLLPLGVLKIKELNFYGFNAPGIEKKINRSFLQCANELPDIKFQLRYFKAHHDMVQTVGNHVLGYHTHKKPLPSNVFTTVIKFRKPEESLGGWNLAKRYALVPHKQYNLCGYEDIKNKIPNNIWIEDIRTNNPSDVGLKFQGLNSDNEPLESVIDYEKTRKSLINKRWVFTIFDKFIKLIFIIGKQIKHVLNETFNLLSSCFTGRKITRLCT